MSKIGKCRFLKCLFRLVWYHWYKDYDIIAVKGWRYAIVKKKDGYMYQGSSPVFWWEGRESYGGFWSFLKWWLSNKYKL